MPRRGVALRIQSSGGLDSTAKLYVLLSSYTGGFDRPDTIATMGASADTSLVVQVPTLQPYSGYYQLKVVASLPAIESNVVKVRIRIALAFVADTNLFTYEGQYGSSFYFYSKTNADWPLADSLARKNGGHLAVITNPKENAFVQSFTLDRKSWLGMRKGTNGNRFGWVTGEPFAYTNWNRNEPNNSGGQETFGEMWDGGGWNDERPTSSRRFVLEVPTLGFSSNAPVCTGDTLKLNFYTSTVADSSLVRGPIGYYRVPGSYALVASPVLNGNYIFSYRDSGRSLPVTKVELKLVSVVDEDQYLMGPRVGNKRFLLSRAATSMARVRSGGAQRFSKCLASASILDTAELRSFNRLLALAPLPDPYLISLADTAVEGRFRWATGDTLRYNNWALGEPGPDPENDFVVATQPNGLWMDADTNTAYPYAAEVPCNFRIEGLPRQPICLLNGLIPLSFPLQFLVEGACANSTSARVEAGIVGSSFSTPIDFGTFRQTSYGIAEYTLLSVGRYAFRLVLDDGAIIALKDTIEIVPGPGAGPGSLAFGNGEARIVDAGPYPKQWYRNGVPIPGATDSIYIDTNAAQVSDINLGGLTATIGYPGCQYTLFDLRLGNKAYSAAAATRLVLIPNPSEEGKGATLLIKSESLALGRCQMQIVTSNGRMVHNSQITAGQPTSNLLLPNLPAGLYTIRVVAAKTVLHTKWLIQGR